MNIQEVWINDYVDKKDNKNSYKKMLITREIRFPKVGKPLKFIKMDLGGDIKLALAKAWGKTYQNNTTSTKT